MPARSAFGPAIVTAFPRMRRVSAIPPAPAPPHRVKTPLRRSERLSRRYGHRMTLFRRIFNAMDRLAAAIEAGVHRVVTMWLKGITAYGLALHGYAPDSHLCGDDLPEPTKIDRDA
jgi:hypothetical protein